MLLFKKGDVLFMDNYKAYINYKKELCLGK